MRAWLRLCKDPKYKNYRRSLKIITRHSADIAKKIDSTHLTVISLGSGQGDKDRILLQALKKRDKIISYWPLDSSRPLLQMALQGARRFRIPAKGLAVDITRAEFRVRLRKAGRPRLFLLLGNTLGGFDPLQMARILRRTLEGGDFLLVDGEIFSGPETLKGYDHPTNRRFVWALLREKGIQETGGKLHFGLCRDRRRKGLFFVRKYFVPHGRKSGKILRMSPSYKYSATTFRQLIRRDISGTLLAQYWSRDKKLLMILARK